MDNEIKGTGNHISFGDYGYDTRLGRRWNIDPLWKKDLSITGYSVFFNKPILYNDQSGKWPLYTHYRITYKALIKIGVNKDVARKIAHYASTYADNPAPDASGKNGKNWKPVMIINIIGGLFNGIKPSEIAYKPDIDYSKTAESQEDGADNQKIHGTFGPEDYEAGYVTTAYDAIDRTYNDAMDVFEKYKGKDINKLDDDALKELGIAYHQIEDITAHEGAFFDPREMFEGDKQQINPCRKTKSNIHNVEYHSTIHDVFGSRKQTKKDVERVTNMLTAKPTENTSSDSNTNTNTKPDENK